MRYRYANPFNDPHKIPMHVYDCIIEQTDPHSVNLAIEHILPHLCIFGRGTVLKERVWVKDHFESRIIHMQDYDETKQGWVNGAVWTSWRLDKVRDLPVLYIALGLYTLSCNDIKCHAGHMSGPVFKYEAVDNLKQWQCDAISEELMEIPNLRLGIRPDLDTITLSSLGFVAVDAPLK